MPCANKLFFLNRVACITHERTLQHRGRQRGRRFLSSASLICLEAHSVTDELPARCRSLESKLNLDGAAKSEEIQNEFHFLLELWVKLFEQSVDLIS